MAITTRSLDCGLGPAVNGAEIMGHWGGVIVYH